MNRSSFNNLFYFSDLIQYFSTRENLKPFAGAVISGVLLIFAFPTKDVSWLIWVGFIPLFFALENKTPKEIYWLSCTAGTILVCGGYLWLPHVIENFMEVPSPFHLLLWLVYGFYASQMIALIFIIYLRFQPEQIWAKIIFFPGVTVTIWSLFPSIFLFQLSNASTNILSSLQGISIVGSDGLDFMIAMSNISGYLLIKSLIKRSLPHRSLVLPLLILIAWFTYGWLSLNQWDKEVTRWDSKKIGLVQPNRTPSLRGLPPEKGFSYERPLELVMSEQLVTKKPDLIVWPEGNLLGFFYNHKIRKSFISAIRSMHIPVIFHDQMVENEGTRKLHRNSSIWITKNGDVGGIYHKRKLVLLGEYIPILNRFEELSRKLGLPISIIAGERDSVFDTGGMLVSPAICYEIMFSQFVAGKIGERGEGKVILVQSNDGWYGQGAQADQHRSATTLRAVENRVPVVHSVYNGPSSIVLPTGKFQFIGDFWKKGGWVVEMPYDPASGGTFFSRHPYLFLNSLRILTLLAILYFATKRRLAAKTIKTS
ncbi:MAG: apolipoprotein N-acyltransferase [Proteobacteria bacterium]|nr:apolipoprotein N-acyltransferase [Pseudomonadota bacterium]